MCTANYNEIKLINQIKSINSAVKCMAYIIFGKVDAEVIYAYHSLQGVKVDSVIEVTFYVLDRIHIL